MKKVFKVVFFISFLIYLLVLLVLLFLNSRSYFIPDLTLLEYIKDYTNLVPFKTIRFYIKSLFDGSMNLDIPIKNLFGNLIMFFPLGIYLPYFIKKQNKRITFLVSIILLLLVIESVQLLSRRGTFDIDDFILNIFGALIGFGIWKSIVVRKLWK